MPSKSTSFYNNYYLEDRSKKSIEENILKDDFTLNYSDYQNLKIAEQYNKLYSNTYGINKENNVLNENNKIFNFVSSDFFRKAGKAYISIMNDFVLLLNDPDRSLNKIGIIFTKENNLIYIGFAVLIISFMFWLIDITS
jgi:hypothetical protein